MLTPPRSLRAFTIGLLATALAISLAPTPAQAGPDDGKVVTTQTHVDAPKTFWESGRFVLKNEAGSSLRPLQDTVNWVGKGYDLRTGKQQYIFDTPEDPVLEPIRSLGQRWYRAPAVPGTSMAPIWAGFGADTNIPVDQFRNGSFSLDIVGFQGPGRMEALVYSEGSLRRLLSSHDPAFRSSYLVPGSHTHNETLFTRPGRYTVTYRTTTRTTEGTIISSDDVPFVWQVGGTRPAPTASAPLQDTFNAAPAGSPATPYTFTISKHEGVNQDGDDLLSDLRFNTGDPLVTGTLTLFINGYHLAKIPVNEGQATWSEMIGSGSSTFHAVFVPSSGQNAPRWISQAVEYSAGAPDAHTTSATASAELPTPLPDSTIAPFTQEEYTPQDLGFTVRTEPQGEDYFATTITLADPRLRTAIQGGYYENLSDTNPTCVINTVSGLDGSATVVDFKESCTGYTLKLRFLPHALMRTPGGEVTLPDPLNDTVSTEQRGTLPGGGSSPSPSPTPTPTPTPEVPANSPVVLSRGHVDIQGRLSDSGELSAVLHDDTLQFSPRSLDRPLPMVALAVDDSARTTRPNTGPLASPAYDFLGPIGASMHILATTWDGVHIWPGWSTLALDEDRVGPAVLSLRPHSIPQGARYSVFTEDALAGTVEKLIDSAAQDTSIDIPSRTHAHASWAFSTPGTYVLSVSLAATVDGQPASSTPQCLTFLIGRQAIADHVAGSTPECSTQPPTPDPAPSATSSTGADNSGSTTTHPASAHVNANRQATQIKRLPTTGASTPLLFATCLGLLIAGIVLITRARRRS